MKVKSSLRVRQKTLNPAQVFYPCPSPSWGDCSVAIKFVVQVESKRIKSSNRLVSHGMHLTNNLVCTLFLSVHASPINAATLQLPPLPSPLYADDVTSHTHTHDARDPARAVFGYGTKLNNACLISLNYAARIEPSQAAPKQSRAE